MYGNHQILDYNKIELIMPVICVLNVRIIQYKVILIMSITGHCLHSGIEPKILGFFANGAISDVNVFIFFLSERHSISNSIFIVTVLLFQLLHVKKHFSRGGTGHYRFSCY